MSLYLWQAEQQRQSPGQQYEDIPALHGLTAVCLQGTADSIVAVHRHAYDHVGWGEHSENLQVFHQTTQKVGAGKAALDVPNQLGQHLREEEEGEVERWGEMWRRVAPSVCLRVWVTWNSATARSARQRLSMNWCSGLWCNLLRSNTVNTRPLPSSAITSATASRASRFRSVTFVPTGVKETTDQSMDGSVTMEMDMLPWRRKERQRQNFNFLNYSGECGRDILKKNLAESEMRKFHDNSLSLRVILWWHT